MGNLFGWIGWESLQIRGGLGSAFLNMLDMGISAAYLIVAVLAARLLLSKAPKNIRCILWAFVGIRLVCPYTLETVFSLVPVRRHSALPAAGLPRAQAYSGILDSSQPLQREVNPLIGGESRISYFIFYACVGLWIAGAILMLAYFLTSYWRLKRKLRTSVPEETVVNGELVKIYWSDKIESPFLFGLVKPKVYLPYSLPDDARPFAIAHELAHKKRRDNWIKPAAYLILTYYWVHPLVWVSYFLLCKDVELACDEKVIGSFGAACKKLYSNALLNCCAGHRHIASCPVAFKESGIKQRINSILGYQKPTVYSFIPPAVICGVVMFCFMTQKDGGSLYGDLAGDYYMAAENAGAEGESLDAPVLHLKEDGNFVFLYNIAMDSVPSGKYIVQEGLIIASRDIGTAQYQFAVLGEGQLRFVQQGSDVIGIPDGSVFLKKDSQYGAIVQEVEEEGELDESTVDSQADAGLTEEPLQESTSDNPGITAYFPDPHAIQGNVTMEVDLDKDGVPEQIVLEDLKYNGGDGGFCLSVLRISGGKEEKIPLPGGYTEENGFPFSRVWTGTGMEIRMPENKKIVLTKEEVSKLYLGADGKGGGKYDAQGLAYLISSDSVGQEIKADAVSGFTVVEDAASHMPVLVVKQYITGHYHADCFGYGVAFLQLQPGSQWDAEYAFLPDL